MTIPKVHFWETQPSWNNCKSDQPAGLFGCFRTYGRASRQLRVATNFVPFNPDIIPRFDEWVLVARPFLHTYWTCCVRMCVCCKIREVVFLPVHTFHLHVCELITSAKEVMFL